MSNSLSEQKVFMYRQQREWIVVKVLGRVSLFVAGLLLFMIFIAPGQPDPEELIVLYRWIGGLGVVFLATLLLPKLYVYGWEVDPFKRTITSSTSILFSASRGDPISFDGVSLITITKEVRGSGKHRTVVYPVCLETEDGEPQKLETPMDYFAARRGGERLAKAMHVPLSDASSGTAVVRRPEKLDMTLREALRREAERPAQPARPAEASSVHQQTREGLVITIPPFPILPLLTSFFLLLTTGAVAVYYLTRPDDGSGWLSTSIFVALGWGAFCFAGSRLCRKETIELTPSELIFTSKFGVFNSRSVIPLSELEELYVVAQEILEHIRDAVNRNEPELPYTGRDRFPASVSSLFRLKDYIIARSDTQELKFGRPLTEEELRYIVWQLESAIHG